MALHRRSHSWAGEVPAAQRDEPSLCPGGRAPWGAAGTRPSIN